MKGTIVDLYIKHGRIDKDYIWIKDNIVLETIMGSHAFGTHNDKSDYDISTIVMPKTEDVYPHKYGKIFGYDQFKPFENYQIKGPKKRLVDNGKEYEIEFISLINFFRIAGLKGSPSVEILFARRNLVKFATKIGWMIRDNNRLFVSLKAVDAIKGFATSQMRRIRTRKPKTQARQLLIKQYGYDTKMASHVLRTLHESIQILQTGNMDLMYNKEEYKLMKEGKWGDIDKLEEEFRNKITYIEELKSKTKIPFEPQEEKLRALLLNILEEFYGSLSNAGTEVEYISTKDVMEMFNKMDNKMNDMSSKIDILHKSQRLK